MGKEFKNFIITKDQKLFKFTFDDMEKGYYYYCEETKEKLTYLQIEDRVLLETDNMDLILQFCANMANKK